MLKSFGIKELKKIFKNRFSTSKKDWDDIKSSFIESGVENLIKEDIDTLTFHIVYYQIIYLTDNEIFESLMEEL